MRKPKEYSIVRAFVINDKYLEITSRYVATRLKLTEAIIEQCFHFMNLEGLLSEAIRPWFAHDRRSNYYAKTKKCEKLSGFEYDSQPYDKKGKLWYRKHN